MVLENARTASTTRGGKHADNGDDEEEALRPPQPQLQLSPDAPNALIPPPW